MQNVQGKDRNLVQMQVAQRRLAVTYPVRFLAGPDFCLAIICVF